MFICSLEAANVNPIETIVLPLCEQPIPPATNFQVHDPSPGRDRRRWELINNVIGVGQAAVSGMAGLGDFLAGGRVLRANLRPRRADRPAHSFE